MPRRINVADLPELDPTPYLDSSEAIAVYLTDILEANDPALLAAALGDIARARGMSEHITNPGGSELQESNPASTVDRAGPDGCLIESGQRIDSAPALATI